MVECLNYDSSRLKLITLNVSQRMSPVYILSPPYTSHMVPHRFSHTHISSRTIISNVSLISFSPNTYIVFWNTKFWIDELRKLFLFLSSFSNLKFFRFIKFWRMTWHRPIRKFSEFFIVALSSVLNRDNLILISVW